MRKRNTVLIMTLLMLVTLTSCSINKKDEVSDNNGSSYENEESQSTAVKSYTDIDNIKLSFEYSVDGYEEEIKKTIQTYDEEKEAGAVSYIFITDLHAGSVGNSNMEEQLAADYRQVQAAVDVANNSDIDFICFGGDTLNEYYSDDNINKEKVMNIMKCFTDILSKSNKPVFIVKGNHDENIQVNGDFKAEWATNPDYVLTQQEWYDVTMAQFPQYATDYHRGYFYYDLPGKNTRVVVFNMVDCDDTLEDGRRIEYAGMNYGLKDEQVQWLLDTALSKENTDYIFVVHDSFRDGTRTYTNKEVMQEIMKAAYTHTDFSSGKFSYDFSKWTGNLKILHCGHYHHEGLELKEEYGGLPVITTECAVSVNYNHASWAGSKFTHIENRQSGRLDEALFDLTILNKNEYQIVRFGAGNDLTLKLNN